MALILYNPQIYPVTAQYLVGVTTKQKTIPPKTQVDLGVASIHPATQTLIDEGTLRLGGNSAPVIQNIPYDSGTPMYFYGPWVPGIKIGVGYIVSHSGIWWMCVTGHLTQTAPSDVNTDFLKFSSIGELGLSGAVNSATTGQILIKGASEWEAGLVGDAQVSAISQAKITGLNAALDGKLSLSGGTMTGHIVLATSPASNNAVRRDWVENNFVAKLGGPITGAISWSGTPTNPNHLVTKSYVDAIPANGLPYSGGTMTGPINLVAGTPTGQNAISRSYADSAYLRLNGGTLTAPVVWGGTPSDPTHLTNKAYVDSSRLAGGYTITSPISWAGTPSNANHLANKAYVDTINPVGKTITSPISWAGPPTDNNHLVPKSYVDSGFLRLTGGTVTGPVTWSGTPTASGHLANKAYVDSSRLAGGYTITSPISWAGTPSNANHLANKAYVDGAIAGSTAVVPITGGIRVYGGAGANSVVEIGNYANSSNGILTFNTPNPYKATISGAVSTLSNDRIYSLPDADGTIVLGDGGGVTDAAAFRGAIGARQSLNALVPLIGDMLASSDPGLDYRLTGDAMLYLTDASNVDGWTAEMRTIVTNTFRIGTVSDVAGITLNGATRAVSAPITVSGQSVTLQSSRFGTTGNAWNLNVTVVSGSGVVVTINTGTSTVSAVVGDSPTVTLDELRLALIEAFSPVLIRISGDSGATVSAFSGSVGGATGTTPTFNVAYRTVSISCIQTDRFMVASY